MVYEARKVLTMGDFDSFGLLMHESWKLKKRLAGSITNGTIDDCMHWPGGLAPSAERLPELAVGGFFYYMCRMKGSLLCVTHYAIYRNCLLDSNLMAQK
jgi:galactokinase/mevalonate kinase-like predicted kinase